MNIFLYGLILGIFIVLFVVLQVKYNIIQKIKDLIAKIKGGK
jgi:hypothetical protein